MIKDDVQHVQSCLKIIKFKILVTKLVQTELIYTI